MTAGDLPAGAAGDSRLRKTLIWLLFAATLSLVAVEASDLVQLHASPVHVIEVEDGWRVVVDLPPHHLAPAIPAAGNSVPA